MNTTTPKYYPNRVTIPKHIAQALDKILEYLWDDEQNNPCRPDESGQTNLKKKTKKGNFFFRVF